MYGDREEILEDGRRSSSRSRPVVIGIIVALLAVPVFGVLSSQGPPEEQPTPEPKPTFSRVVTEPNVLIPPARADGGTVRFEATFPDGSTVTVGYPADLALAEMGVRPYIGVELEGGKLLFRDLVAPWDGGAALRTSGPMIRNLAGNVSLWPPPPGSGNRAKVMLYEFGPWKITLHDWVRGFTFEQRVTLAEDLRGRVTDDGWLVLTGTGRVRLSRIGDLRMGEPVGPQLWLGGGLEDMVALVPQPDCDRKLRVPTVIRDRGRYHDAVCRDEIVVAASGEREFVDRLLDKIEIRRP